MTCRHTHPKTSQNTLLAVLQCHCHKKARQRGKERSNTREAIHQIARKTDHMHRNKQPKRQDTKKNAHTHTHTHKPAPPHHADPLQAGDKTGDSPGKNDIQLPTSLFPLATTATRRVGPTGVFGQAIHDVRHIRYQTHDITFFPQAQELETNLYYELAQRVADHSRPVPSLPPYFPGRPRKTSRAGGQKFAQRPQHPRHVPSPFKDSRTETKRYLGVYSRFSESRRFTSDRVGRLWLFSCPPVLLPFSSCSAS